MGRRIRPNDLNMQVRKQILSAMESQEISRSQLARLMGVTPSHITQTLREGHNFTVDTLQRISRALNVQFVFRMEE